MIHVTGPDNKMLIGVCGKAGAGKDTVGDYLVKNYNFEKIALADPIKRLVQDVFVLSSEEVHDRSLREQPMEKWDNWSVRRLLQFIGTELFRKNITEEIWVKSLWYRAEQSLRWKNLVVTDVRFPNELEFLKKHAGISFGSIKVTRDGCDGNVGSTGHESEKYDLDTDISLTNNGSIENLHTTVDEALKNNFKQQTFNKNG